MKWLTLVTLLLPGVTPSSAEPIDKEAILGVLRTIETEQILPNGEKKKVKLVADLLDEPFRTEFGFITPENLRNLRYEKEYTIYGNQKMLRSIDHELVVVTHDTGFIGGFIAYLEKTSNEVVLIQIVSEG